MEPTTLILVLSIPALIAGVALAVQNRKATDTHIIDAARERAKQRTHERAFADTEPEDDPYRTGLNFVMESGVAVTEDAFTSHGQPLSAEQAHTIGMIFEGYRPEVKHRASNSLGKTPMMAAGVPLNLTALDSRNSVLSDLSGPEYLAPEVVWPDHIRG
jgi:hypothetical protein